MSLLSEPNPNSSHNRNLGDEWDGWDGRDEGTIREGRGLFIGASAFVIFFIDVLLCLLVYMISPRLMGWNAHLPKVVWVLTLVFVATTIIWFIQTTLTITTSRNFFFLKPKANPLFDLIFAGVFKFAQLVGISRDRMGHSFVRSYNEISRATKRPSKHEKLLLLLPRCLTKEQLKEINALKEKYPLHIHTVSGGELARKRIKELRPTAVIGVACERDLVSGIKDVGKKISLIGIPNMRPDGPCKNTQIDMDELIRAIEFYVGKPVNREAVKP